MRRAAGGNTDRPRHGDAGRHRRGDRHERRRFEWHRGGALRRSDGQQCDAGSANGSAGIESGGECCGNPFERDQAYGFGGGGFSPNSFTVSAGAPVTISITSGDQYSHVFAFEDASLSAVAVGVGPGETRAITFNAPKTAGAYKFYSNIPGQSGEAGVMTVK